MSFIHAKLCEDSIIKSVCRGFFISQDTLAQNTQQLLTTSNFLPSSSFNQSVKLQHDSINANNNNNSAQKRKSGKQKKVKKANNIKEDKLNQNQELKEVEDLIDQNAFENLTEENLVVARGNILELYSIKSANSPRGYQVSMNPLQNLDLNSTINKIDIIRTRARNYLFIILQHKLFASLLYFDHKGMPVETSHGSLNDVTNERKQGKIAISIDRRNSSFISVYCFKSILKVIPLALNQGVLQMQPCYDLFVTHQNIFSIQLIQPSKIQGMKRSRNSQNNRFYYFLALQEQNQSHMQIVVYRFDIIMKEIQIISGPQIGPNPNRTKSNALAIPIRDVFQIKPIRAIVDQEDNGVMQNVRMIVWTLRNIYIVDWRRNDLIEMVKKPNYRAGLVRDLPNDSVVYKFPNPFIGKPENVMEANQNRYLYINSQNQLLQLNLLGRSQKITQDQLGTLANPSGDTLYFPPMKGQNSCNDGDKGETQGFVILCQNRIATELYHIMKKFNNGGRIVKQENVQLRKNRTQGPIMNFVLSEGQYVQEMFAVCGDPGIVQKIQMGTKISANIGTLQGIQGLLNMFTFQIKQGEYLVLSFAKRSIGLKVGPKQEFNLMFQHELSGILTRDQRILICELIIDNNFLLIGTTSTIEIIDINVLNFAQATPILIFPTSNNLRSQSKVVYQQFSFNGHTLLASVYNSAASDKSKQNEIHSYNLYGICNSTTSASSQATVLKAIVSNKTVLNNLESKVAQNWGDEISALSSAPVSLSFETYEEISKFGCVAVLAYWNGNVQFRHASSGIVIEQLKRKQNSYPVCSIVFLPAFTTQKQSQVEKSSEFASMYQLVMGNLDGCVDIMLYNPRAAQLLSKGLHDELESLSVISLRRILAVGNSPINLTKFVNQEHQCVMLGCDYPTVLYWINEKECVNSRLLCDQVTQACKFSSGLILYSQGEQGGKIVFTQPRSISKLQIDSYDCNSIIRKTQFDNTDENLQMNVKNLCYIKELEAIALIVDIYKKEEMVIQDKKQMEESFKTNFTRIMVCRSGNMSYIGSYDLGENELCNPIISEYKAELGILILLIGTAIIEQQEFIPGSGRLLALSVNKSQDEGVSAFDDEIDSKSLLTLHSQKLFNGGVFQIQKYKMYDDVFICGIGHILHIVKLQVETQGFTQLGQIRSNFNFIVCIDNIQDQILVGDVSNGVQLFQATPQMIQNTQNQINTIQIKRKAGSITGGMASVVLFIDKNIFLTADDNSNILAYDMNVIFQKNKPASYLYRSELTPISGFKVGNKVTKLQKGSLVKIAEGYSAEEVNPVTGMKYEGFQHSIVYSTNTGGIGVLIMIQNKQTIRFLKRVEDGLDISLRPIAGVKRGLFRNSWEKQTVLSSILAARDGRSQGFVDMEFLESFSKLDPIIMQIIVDHASTPQWSLKNYPSSNQELVSMIQSLKKYF